MKRTAFFLSILFLATLIAPVFVMAANSKKIRIAVMDFAPKGQIKPSEARQISEIIRNEIVGSLCFDVVERSQVNRMLGEASLQMTGITDSASIIRIGRMISVKQLIIGTVGKLYGKVIITLRLVNAETGKNIFASTLYSTKESVFDDIKNIVSDIGNNAMIFSMDVTIKDIKDSIDDDNYKKAWFQLNRYRELNPTTDELVKLKKTITGELSHQYYKEAKRALGRNHFRDAKNKINYAIAIENREKYIRFRDEVKEEEEEYHQEIAMARMRRQRKLREYGASYESFSTKVRKYYSNLTYSGLFLAASSGIEITDQYEFKSLWYWWGCDILGMTTYGRKRKQILSNNWTAYGGLNFRYIDTGSGISNEFAFQFYGAPFSSLTIKLSHIFLTVGIDAGLMLRVSDTYDNNALVGLSVGATLLTQFKYLQRLGIFVGAKFDYEYYPGDNQYSFFNSRLMAGLVF